MRTPLTISFNACLAFVNGWNQCPDGGTTFPKSTIWNDCKIRVGSAQPRQQGFTIPLLRIYTLPLAAAMAFIMANSIIVLGEN